MRRSKKTELIKELQKALLEAAGKVNAFDELNQNQFREITELQDENRRLKLIGNPDLADKVELLERRNEDLIEINEALREELMNKEIIIDRLKNSTRPFAPARITATYPLARFAKGGIRHDMYEENELKSFSRAYNVGLTSLGRFVMSQVEEATSENWQDNIVEFPEHCLV